MYDILPVVAVIGLAVVIILQLIAWSRSKKTDVSGLAARLELLERLHERTERTIREENSTSREESTRQSRGLREEVGTTLKGVCDTLIKTQGEMSEGQRARLDSVTAQLAKMTESNEKKIEALKLAVEQKLTSLQEANSKKLDQMRQTVDEKLQGTLEKRLGESFKMVSERLEQVYQGLGEMRSLATGVGDLKKVLTNVKVRGTWGEIQLGNLLEQVLSPEQYSTNVVTRKESNERVEFAIRLPGRDGQANEPVWLPIDAKFPKEDYERLIEASERADADGVENAGRMLEQRIKSSARDISEKYLNPPKTTDFAVLFLPSEGLYAEVLRRPGLVDALQRDFRISLAGPTTLTALLNSLQMGFRTLAIQKRSSEVWSLLGAVKTEFGKFGDVIEKVQKKIQEAGNVIDSAAVRTRAIERKLRDVEQLPGEDARVLLGPDEEA